MIREMSSPFQWAGRRGLGAESGLRRFLSLMVVCGVSVMGCTIQKVPADEEEAAGQPSSTGAGARAGAMEAPVDSAETAAQVADMLHASSASWNAGDLAGFLDDYWRSEGLTFSGATGVTRGWEEVRERYERSYWAPGAQRDSLRFQALEVTPLGPGYALALGQYILYRPEEGDRVTSEGFFSLVLQRMDGTWKIIHDHTSAAPLETGGPGGP